MNKVCLYALVILFISLSLMYFLTSVSTIDCNNRATEHCVEYKTFLMHLITMKILIYQQYRVPFSSVRSLKPVCISRYGGVCRIMVHTKNYLNCQKHKLCIYMDKWDSKNM